MLDHSNTDEKGSMKENIVLFACSVTRALYMEILADLTTEEFLKFLKTYWKKGSF